MKGTFAKMDCGNAYICSTFTLHFLLGFASLVLGLGAFLVWSLDILDERDADRDTDTVVVNECPHLFHYLRFLGTDMDTFFSTSAHPALDTGTSLKPTSLSMPPRRPGLLKHT